MEALSDARVVDVWERGKRRDPIGRALTLLAAARPDLAAHELARVDVFQRDRALMALRAATFGARLPGYADCPECHERLEFELDGVQAAPLALAGGGGPTEVELESGARFRLPTSEDLAAVSSSGAGADEAVHLLVERCLQPRVVPPAADGRPMTAQPLPLGEVERALVAFAEAADVDVRLDFTCVACGHRWIESLDVAHYLWEEIDERAERVLDDVHVLASWYGWSEHEILALGETRRCAYLERCRAGSTAEMVG